MTGRVLASGAMVRLLLVSVALAAAAHAAPLAHAGERIPGAIRAGFAETIVADSLDSPVSGRGAARAAAATNRQVSASARVRIMRRG